MLSQTAILATGMLLSGSINTIASRFQDNTEFPNGTAIDPALPPTKVDFTHPLVQTFTMFIGEFLCLVAFCVQYLWRRHQKNKVHHHHEELEGEAKIIKFNPIIFALPALCDTTATTLMYLGLALTYTSVYQMLRGAVVVFTAIFSVLFLKRKLQVFHWVGVLVIVIGTILVGLYSVLTPSSDGSGSGSGSDQAASNPLVGDILVLLAQIIAAAQMVIEEKFIGKYKVPALLVVGFEGCWGILYTVILLSIFTFGKAITVGDLTLDNAVQAFKMIGASGSLLAWILVGIFSIAFFNFFGISVTSSLGASHRMILDTCRTLIVTAFALLTNIWLTPQQSWQPLNLPEQRYYLALMFFGFAVLVLGAVIYFKVVNINPYLRRIGFRSAVDDEDETAGSINDDSKGRVQKVPLLGDHRKGDE